MHRTLSPVSLLGGCQRNIHEQRTDCITRKDQSNRRLRQRRETKELATPDRSKSPRQEARQHSCRHLENVGVELRLGRQNELHETETASKEKGYREIDRSGLKCERADTSTREPVHPYKNPSIVSLFSYEDGLQPLHGLLDSNHVVQGLFVDFMHFTQLAEIDGLTGANNLDFGGVRSRVVE